MLHMSIPLPCASGSKAASSIPYRLPSNGIVNLPTLLVHPYISIIYVHQIRTSEEIYIEQEVKEGKYRALGRTLRPDNERRFSRRSLSRMDVSALCSQQSAITATIRPSSSLSSYAFMKWKVTYKGTSTLATFIPSNHIITEKRILKKRRHDMIRKTIN